MSNIFFIFELKLNSSNMFAQATQLIIFIFTVNLFQED